MQDIIAFLVKPWPWYVTGPLIGSIVPILLLTSQKQFGVSSIFKHICTITKISKSEYFNYSVKDHSWNLLFILGVVFAGFFSFQVIEVKQGFLSENAIQYFVGKEITIEGIFPVETYRWDNLFSVYGLLLIVGGFLVGFGSRYADGCTSGHAIMGLSLLSPASLVAVIGFFVGGIIGTFLILDSLL